MAYEQNKNIHGKIALNISSNKQNIAEMKEKEIFIESLQAKLHDKNEEIEKYKLEMKELNEKYKQVLLNYNEYKMKYYQIEQYNEEYIKSLGNDMEQFKEKTKQLELLNENLVQQLNKRETEYQQLSDKAIYQADTIKNLETQLLQYDNDLNNVKKTYAVQLKAANEKADEDISNLRSEFERSKKELQEACDSKDTIIMEKCKIITEQAYKMREIEKVCERPVKCVSSVQTDINKENERNVQSNHEELQSQAPSQFQRSTTSKVALPDKNVQKTTLKKTRKRRLILSPSTNHFINHEELQSQASSQFQRSTTSKVALPDKNVQKTTLKKTRKRRLILSPSVSPSSQNVINLINDESDNNFNNTTNNSSETPVHLYRANSNVWTAHHVVGDNLSPKRPKIISDIFDMLKYSTT